MCIYVRIYAFHAKEELDINAVFDIIRFHCLALIKNSSPPSHNEYLGMGMVDGKLLLMIRT